jgi:hypothetical protein
MVAGANSCNGNSGGRMADGMGFLDVRWNSNGESKLKFQIGTLMVAGKLEF